MCDRETHAEIGVNLDDLESIRAALKAMPESDKSNLILELIRISAGGQRFDSERSKDQ